MKDRKHRCMINNEDRKIKYIFPRKTKNKMSMLPMSFMLNNPAVSVGLVNVTKSFATLYAC